MKRVGRWLFNLAAAVSLVLLVATLLLWIRSTSYEDRLYHEGWSLYSSCGAFVLSRGDMYGAAPTYEAARVSGTFGVVDDFDAGVRIGGFGFTSFVNGSFGVKHLLVSFPHWAVCVLFAIASAWSFVRARQRPDNRHESSICVHCGYDLRATPQRCPECGMLPSGVAESLDPRITPD